MATDPTNSAVEAFVKRWAPKEVTMINFDERLAESAIVPICAYPMARRVMCTSGSLHQVRLGQPRMDIFCRPSRCFAISPPWEKMPPSK